MVLQETVWVVREQTSNAVAVLSNAVAVLTNAVGVLTNTVGVLTLYRSFDREKLGQYHLLNGSNTVQPTHIREEPSCFCFPWNTTWSAITSGKEDATLVRLCIENMAQPISALPCRGPTVSCSDT